MGKVPVKCASLMPKTFSDWAKQASFCFLFIHGLLVCCTYAYPCLPSTRQTKTICYIHRSRWHAASTKSNRNNKMTHFFQGRRIFEEIKETHKFHLSLSLSLMKMKIMLNTKYTCLITSGNTILYLLMKCDATVFMETQNKVKL